MQQILKVATLLCGLALLAACQPANEAKQQPNDQAAAVNTQAPTDSLPEITAENHDALMDQLVGQSAYNIKTVGVLVYNDVNVLDVMGPAYVLGQLWGVKTQLIGLEPGPISTVMGHQLVPHTVIDSVQQLDILVVPGGFKGTILGAYDERLLNWIRQIDQNSVFTTSVCTGGWILAATGLLEGRKATTNWYRAPEMLARHGVTFEKKRYVQDGKYWTAAGVTAGMDMALAIMQEVRGTEYTQAIMLDMEYDPAPPVQGGSPEKTPKEVYQMMLAMYDMGVQPLVDSLEQARQP